MSLSNKGFGFAFAFFLGGAFAIFSMVWLIGLNYCPNEPCEYTRTSSEPVSSVEDEKWELPTVRRGTFSYEVEPKFNEEGLRQIEYYDLRAQERMAHATDWIAWITAVSGFFGALGMGALVYTLFLQREANQIMRDEQRPWLSIQSREAATKVLSKCHINDPDKDFFVIVENHGISPATNIVSTFRFFCTDEYTATEAADDTEVAFFENFGVENLPDTVAFRGDSTAIAVESLPPNKRFLGSGENWAILIICFYKWQGKILPAWIYKEIEMSGKSQ